MDKNPFRTPQKRTIKYLAKSPPPSQESPPTPEEPKEAERNTPEETPPELKHVSKNFLKNFLTKNLITQKTPKRNAPKKMWRNLYHRLSTPKISR